MVRMSTRAAAANGGRHHPKDGSNGSDVDTGRKIRYAVFLFALVVLLFRNERSTVQSVQQATRTTPVRSPTTTTRQQPLAPSPSSVPPGKAPTVDRFENDGGGVGMGAVNETLPDLQEVLAESKRDNMTIRFSNESWVLDWRLVRPAKRAQKPVRNIDWSQVECPDSTEKWETCDLSDDRWGVSVVLISFGRSGSSITWETMSNLASERGQPAREDIGGSSTSAFKELNSIRPEEHGKCWLERILCRHQYNNRVAIQQGEGKAEVRISKKRQVCPEPIVG